ncbi:MAG TPA: hypothetical protein VIM73_11575 [Polyangiaceae bacterium]
MRKNCERGFLGRKRSVGRRKAGEFLAKVTHAKIFKISTPLERALAQVSAWLRSPLARTIGEDEGYFDVLSSTLRQARTTGSRVHDARIAALCVAHGVDLLWSADRNFGQFPRLRVENPLV